MYVMCMYMDINKQEHVVVVKPFWVWNVIWLDNYNCSLFFSWILNNIILYISICIGIYISRTPCREV